MSKITIIGAGAMGSALTVPLIKNNHEVRLWGTELDHEIINALLAGKPHPKHKCSLPSAIRPFKEESLAAAMQDTDIVIMAITSDALGMIFERVVPYLHPGMMIGSVSKGFEYDGDGNVVLLPEILKERLPKHLTDTLSFVFIGGPCKAVEVVWESPTSVTYSSTNLASAKHLQKTLMTDVYRVEVNTDVTGTEICAAMKNAYAVGLGMAEGFKKRKGFLHNNTKSALFTFAIAEMGILSQALGGTLLSVYGLPGVGDLEVTGEAGRNRTLGEVIGEGLTASQAITKMKEEGITVEGYPAIRFGYLLAKQLERETKLAVSDLPLLTGLYKILYEDAPGYETITTLLKQCTGAYK
jgi:glycerol-3-phosphate dehydrogenase (NAD(P)+)